jgi:trk system potassium uptake protein TrkA
MEIAVIGLGNFGYRLALSLMKRGSEVIAIDNDSKIIEEIKDLVTYAICLDSTDEKSLRANGIHEVDLAVVAIGEDVEKSILITAILKRLGISKVLSRGITPLQSEILKEIGASEVLFLEYEMGELLAEKIMAPQIHERIQLASGHSLMEITPRHEFVGKSLADINFRARFGVNVISIKKKNPIIRKDGSAGFEIVINDLPGPQDVLTEYDILVVVGSDAKLEVLTRENAEI